MPRVCSCTFWMTCIFHGGKPASVSALLAKHDMLSQVTVVFVARLNDNTRFYEA